MHHSANFIEHLYEPGAVLNPVGLKKPHTLISRSLQSGEEDRIQGRWKLLLLKDGLEKGGRMVGGRVCRHGGGGERLFGGGVVGEVRVPVWNSLPPAASLGLVLSLSQIT